MEQWIQQAMPWVIAGGSGLTVGLILGLELGFRRWRRNADEIQRVEWRGRLYKVEYAEAGWRPK